MVREAVRGDGSRSKERDRLLRVNCQKVPVDVLLVTNHGIDVGHLGLNESWFKLCHIFSVPIHEDDVDDVVTDVSLPLHLLFVGKDLIQVVDHHKESDRFCDLNLKIG